MSDNRSRYSSAPLQNMRRVPRRGSRPQPPRTVGDYQDMAAPQRNFTVLQVLLTIALPICFFVSLLVRSTQLYIAFALLSAGCLLIMWLMNAFVANARMTLSILHIAMILVAVFAVWISAPPPQQPSQQQSVSGLGGTAAQEGDLASIFDKESSASIAEMAAQEAASQPTGTPNPGSASLAQQRLEQFMSAWVTLNYDDLISFSLPSWVSQQKDARRAMFQVLANRSPIDFTVLDVSGSDADSTRTVSMDATISKNNGQPPLKYNMQVLMMRINDVWYVDPSSLASGSPIQQQGSAKPVVTVAPLVTASPDMVLYYNPEGGALYHVNPECPSTAARFLPFKGSFTFSQINDAAYASLQPCTTCHAPARGQ